MTAQLAEAPFLQSRGLVVWQGPCLEEWLDYNGHMNETYYLLAMSQGSDRFMELVGCDAAYREAGLGTLYTLETHLRYFAEVLRGEVLTVTTQLVDRDTKRLRLYSQVWRAGEGAEGLAENPAAAAEFLLLHVAGAPPRSAPFAPVLEAGLEALEGLQAGMARPEDTGRGIVLGRR
ncbi:MAG: thioesterase family protein [Pseudomonadota bacterium]